MDGDSDVGSISWEEFFGRSETDLVGQLVEMFDDLVRREDEYATNHVVSPSCNISAALQERLSGLVSQNQRESLFGAHMAECETPHNNHQANKLPDCFRDDDASSSSSTSSLIIINHHEQPDDISPSPRRFARRRNGSRPVSGSSIASSTSSSGCSNQGNTCTNNPYLASVESLADTCASSQGSGDSGVVTISEASCRIADSDDNQLRNCAVESCMPRYCDRNLSPVHRVLLEIVDTEAIYVEHLRQVIQGYLVIWRNDPSSLIKAENLNQLFSNIEPIFEFNRQFLTEIDNCGLNPISMANVFIKHNDGFKVYTEYCTNYPRTVSVLTDLMGEEEIAAAFRERQAALRHDLPLGSFLLKPVQRILKYHLLLQNLLKEYGADSDENSDKEEGKAAISGAITAMTGIAQHINAMKRKHEHAVRVQEIQSLLYGWPGPDLTTFGELVAEGEFRMRGAKAPRHAFLFEKMLLLTKKREDGLLVYKSHIMCSNLTLRESIPCEPCSFHVIQHCPRLQYILTAKNLDQKREWTGMIKRIMLEEFQSKIPFHTHQALIDNLAYEYDKQKDWTRRKSDNGLREKLGSGRKAGRKSDTSVENSPAVSRKLDGLESQMQSLRRSQKRSSKVKNRFKNWRRKSEPGFRSYVEINPSDNEEQTTTNNNSEIEVLETESESVTASAEPGEQQNSSNTAFDATATVEDKQSAEAQAQTVEEIVRHIVVQNQEFQRILEKQRLAGTVHMRQRASNHRVTVDTSDDSEDESSNSRSKMRALRREQRIMRSCNHYDKSHQTNCDKPSEPEIKFNSVRETRALFEKSHLGPAHDLESKRSFNEDSKSFKTTTAESLNEKDNGTYDNLKSVWHNWPKCNQRPNDSPTQPAIWLTKLCHYSLPTSPQKSGSLPRSFQISPGSQLTASTTRFLQRDGKPISDRPFTIASDKPAEINLEDMERYASTCQPGGRIAKFPTCGSTHSFCPLDESFTDSNSELHISACSTPSIHPDHKIYRTNNSTGIFKSVFSRAGSRLQGLRTTPSTETLESDDLDRKNSHSNLVKKKKLPKVPKSSRETFSDAEEIVSCVPTGSSAQKPSLYYKQGSSGLGARIAQSDYADPSFLFAETLNNSRNQKRSESEDKYEIDFEKSFEIIENHVDYDESFRDSAIFSDTEELTSFRELDKVNCPAPPPIPPKSLRLQRKGHCRDEKTEVESGDISFGQSQTGWVKKMVHQLQQHQL